MKAKLYAKQYRPEYIDTLVWEGELDCIPRVGDTVFAYEGWGGIRLDKVYWELPTNEVELSFEDRSGEWTTEAKKRLSQQDTRRTDAKNGVHKIATRRQELERGK